MNGRWEREYVLLGVQKHFHIYIIYIYILFIYLCNVLLIATLLLDYSQPTYKRGAKHLAEN